MKRKSITKALAMCLALSLTSVSLFSCGNTDESSSTTEKETETAATTEATEETTADTEKESVEAVSNGKFTSDITSIYFIDASAFEYDKVYPTEEEAKKLLELLDKQDLSPIDAMEKSPNLTFEIYFVDGSKLRQFSDKVVTYEDASGNNELIFCITDELKDYIYSFQDRIEKEDKVEATEATEAETSDTSDKEETTVADPTKASSETAETEDNYEISVTKIVYGSKTNSDISVEDSHKIVDYVNTINFADMGIVVDTTLTEDMVIHFSDGTTTIALQEGVKDVLGLHMAEGSVSVSFSDSGLYDLVLKLKDGAK